MSDHIESAADRSDGAPGTSRTSPAAVRSVSGRIVALLAAFATSSSGTLTITELAHRTGLPLSTVHRLCGQLAAERLLERMPSGGFRIGLRLWEIGTLAPRSHGLRELALPFLEDLHDVTRQHVQLMVLDGTEAVVVERLSSHTAVPLESRSGGRLPLHATGGGIAMLAFADEATVRTTVEQGLHRHTPSTITTVAGLETAMTTLRRQGWIELDGHLTPTAVSIAAPVLLKHGMALGAVSVVVSRGTDTARLVPALLTTVRAIARAVSTARGGPPSR